MCSSFQRKKSTLHDGAKIQVDLLPSQGRRRTDPLPLELRRGRIRRLPPTQGILAATQTYLAFRPAAGARSRWENPPPKFGHRALLSQAVQTGGLQRSGKLGNRRRRRHNQRFSPKGWSVPLRDRQAHQRASEGAAVQRSDSVLFGPTRRHRQEEQRPSRVGQADLGRYLLRGNIGLPERNVRCGYDGQARQLEGRSGQCQRESQDQGVDRKAAQN